MQIGYKETKEKKVI